MEKFNFNNNEEYTEYVLDKANKVLDKCEIYGTASERHGLRTNVENSIRAKANLMEIFKKSPYHNGKGQLVIQMEIERPIDEDIVSSYSQYIRDIANKYLLTEATIDGYTYNEAYTEYNKYERLVRAINYTCLSDEDVIIKGESFGKFRERYRELDKILERFDNEYYYVGNDKYISYDDKAKYDKAGIVADAILHCIGHLLEDENDIEKLAEAFPRSQCRAGIKISRVVQKCLKEIGLYDIAIENEKETFNKRYSNWTDAVSPMKVKKWSVLSINFVDYLTMSHGQNWTSCLNTDIDGRFTNGKYRSGFNSRRTLDYALDSTTMVFYTVDENYDGNEFELQPKQTRQLFHFGEGKLVQARLYPQDNVSRRNIYTQYRENVEFLLADAMNEANLWGAPKRGVIECGGSVVETPYSYSSHGEYIDFLDIACHGGDERDFQSEVNYVVFRGSNGNEDNKKPMIIGSTNAVCIMCGYELSDGYTKSISCC